MAQTYTQKNIGTNCHPRMLLSGIQRLKSYRFPTKTFENNKKKRPKSNPTDYTFDHGKSDSSAYEQIHVFCHLAASSINDYRQVYI